MESSSGYRVLVVEDEGLIAHDIAHRLEALGHRVAGTVSTAEEAIEQAGEADVVLMDIRIDGERDGIQAANEIRDRYHVPVVFLTAHADRSTLERARIAGPYGYIVKPLGPATLQASIEIAVYKHSMERRLEEREAWLRTTLAATAEAMVAADPQGRILLMNPAAEALTGWSQVEGQGQPLDAVVRLTQKDAEKNIRDLESLATLRDAPVSLEAGLELISRTGRRAQVEGTVAPVRVPGGTVGVVVSLHDVTTQRWQESRLRQSQRTETAGRLAASVAGEFDSLIGIIRNQASLLTAQFGEYSAARRSIDELQQAVTEADQITRRLAHLGARQPARPEVANLNSIVRRIARTIEQVAGATLTVAIQPKSGAGRILTDTAQLEQAIMSLVLHACAVTAAGGTLKVETSHVEGSDGRGAGFAALTLSYSATEADVERLFDPAGTGESGFALAVAQSIVAEHGGILSARSLAGGSSAGTEIVMLLPTVEEKAMAAGVTSAGASARTVLLIEEREPVRAHLHNALEARGYNLIEAGDAEEAITLCEVQDTSVDLLIAASGDAGKVVAALGEARRPGRILRLVDHAEKGIEELQRPFTQEALLGRIGALLGSGMATPAAASGRS